MSESQVPEVRFNESNATLIYPRPELKNAVLVRIPLTEDGMVLPTIIKPEWGGVQVFYGSYYAIVKNGEVIYGSAKEQWDLMHSMVRPGYWVKTAVPTAYQATEACRIVTLIPAEDGNIREANYVLDAGDWIVRQPGGEVQHIKASKYGGIYFSTKEAAELGLTMMSPEQFARWAVAQVRDTAAV